MISKDILERLEVFFPHLGRQKEIVALASLAEEEQLLLKRLANKRRQCMDTVLLRLAEGA